MSGKRKISGQNWEFDGSTITVRIPMTWKRQGGRKVIIAPDGSDAWAPTKPRSDDTLIRALARAHRWKRLLDEGVCRSAGEIAEAEGLTRSFVNRLLRLTLLAPDIVVAILDGRQPKRRQLVDSTQALPSAWEMGNAETPPSPAITGGSFSTVNTAADQRAAPLNPDGGHATDGRKATPAKSARQSTLKKDMAVFSYRVAMARHSLSRARGRSTRLRLV